MSAPLFPFGRPAWLDDLIQRERIEYDRRAAADDVPDNDAARRCEAERIEAEREFRATRVA